MSTVTCLNRVKSSWERDSHEVSQWGPERTLILILSGFKIRIWKELPTQRKPFLVKLTFISRHSDFSSHVTFSKAHPSQC